MNVLLPITYFALIATAAANAGYNYQQPRSAIDQNLRPPVHNNIYSGQQAPPFNSFSANFPPVSAPSNQYLQPQAPPHSYSPPPALQTAASAPQAQRQAIISKDIYIHSAPEEYEEINNEQSIESSPVHKNYRIVFIKAPSHNIKINSQAMRQAQAANEEKTVIYVLSKKPDIANLQSQMAALQSDQKASKPEVYFIKYRTQEEASRAQQDIQAQYEALGGTTRISDEGVAPVTSVIGGGPASAGSFSGGSNFAQAASNTQQQFVQQPIQGSQRLAPSANFGIETPSNRYLPVRTK